MPFLQANYKKIHYADWPPTNGQPPRETFLLVHGLGSSQNYYAAVAPHLTAAGYRVIALDTTGQGRSPYTGIEQTAESLATDMADALDALSIARAVVVGHSMGGITVPTLAALRPERVAAVVLLGPVYPNPGMREPFGARIASVTQHGMQPMADSIPYSAVGSRATALHRAFIRELLLGSQPDGYVSMCRVILHSMDHIPAYGRITCPFYVIAGEEDKSAPLEGCQRILNEVGTPSGEKKLDVLKGWGHWMAVETPDEVGRLIVDFFKSVQ